MRKTLHKFMPFFFNKNPEPGETWELQLIDPFADRPKIKILEIKQGWARFQKLGSSEIKTNTLSGIRFFYKKI